MSLADELLAALNDPTHMWSHALRESSRDSQRLFLAMALLPQPISADDLQVVHSAERVTREEPFIDSLRALEDSFVKVEAGGFIGDSRWVDFRNPSLQDFAYEYIDKYSDWLDTLLSSPVYYEQVAEVYNLAMAHSPGTWTTPKKGNARLYANYQEGPIKYQNIKQWVTVRHESLIIKALELATSGGELNFYHFKRYNDKPNICVKLKGLLEILSEFGIPDGKGLKSALSGLVEHALEPSDDGSANVMVDLLRADKTAQIIRAHSSEDPMQTLRNNILDKDTWKFSILSKIDSFLGVDYEDYMADWGDEYVSYAEQLVFNMSDDADYSEYSQAIDELENISSFLGVDLNDAISALERARADIPNEDESQDYEDYGSSSEPSPRQSNPHRELDRIFSSLLE